VREILEYPERYKPLRNVLKGCHRTQIGSFVLIFEIDYEKRVVAFVKFAHHDDAYK
jgi:mRNA-degrading endonuclease RelE of RelBE toxin-antitoxin system